MRTLNLSQMLRHECLRGPKERVDEQGEDEPLNHAAEQLHTEAEAVSRALGARR